MKNILTGNENELTEKEIEKIEKQLQKRHQKVVDEDKEDQLHNQMQYHLLVIGNALGYDVITASNDRSKTYDG